MCDCGKNRTAPPKRIPRNIPKALPNNFNWRIYKELNPDLSGYNTEQQIMNYWHTIGNKENRKHSVVHITMDFNWENYKRLNPDLIFDQQADYELHWIKMGQHENRKYKD